MLKINESTAKSILKLYRQTGSVSSKHKSQNRSVLPQEHSSVPKENEGHYKDVGSVAIENEGEGATIPATQNYVPPIYYYYSEPYYPSLCMMFPSTIF